MTERQPTPGVHENFAEDLSPLPPANVLHLTCPTWQSMDSAPKDRDILVETADFGIIQARWDPSVTNFYKSQEGWASFDPDNAKGDWVADFCTPGDTDRRLYCGATPGRWAELPSYEAPPPPEPHTLGLEPIGEIDAGGTLKWFNPPLRKGTTLYAAPGSTLAPHEIECVCKRAICTYDADFGCGIDRSKERHDV
ncbi:MAG TPA: hypothetical protein VFY63_04900 [Pseudorhizobium sp.]|nr:hypothetical protein [Pseudorhizobium sp.]